MVEDLELNALIKDAFESEGEFELKRRSSSFRWTVPTMLLAASLAVVASFQVLFDSKSDRLSAAILLLSDADGIELDGEASSPESLLLAWQEAPLADAAD